MKKRFFGVLTALALCLTLLPTSALATEPTGTALTQSNVGESGMWLGSIYDEDASYYLAEDITVNVRLNIDENVTLDLNGHTLTANKGIQVGSTTDGASLTINDSSADGTGRLSATGLTIQQTNTEPDETYYQNYGIYANGNLTVNGGTVEAIGADCNLDSGTNVDSYGICLDGTLTVNGGSVTGTGGDVQVSSTDTTITRCIGIIASQIVVNDGTVIGKGGTSDVSQKTSRGIYSWVNGLSVKNGTVKGSAASDGEAISTDGKLLSISGGTFNGKLFISRPDEAQKSLSGGTFNDGVSILNGTYTYYLESLLAEGYCYDVGGSSMTGEGVTTLGGTNNPVSVVRELNSSNFSTAFSGNGGNYKLTGDITLDSIPKITGTVTLDLNGHVLKRTGGCVIMVESSGRLTLKDSNKTKPHYFTVDDTGLWKYVSDTEPTSGEYKTVTGGIITGGKAPFGGGGVYVKGGSFTMSGGSIVGCTATGEYTSMGGGVC